MTKLSKYDVKNWIETIANGEFHYKGVLDGQVDPASHGYLRKIMHELCKEDHPVCEPIGRRDGYYRPVQNHALPLDWQNIKKRVDSGLILPFDLRKYVFIYPDTATIFAGSKSSGKTGALYRTVVLNMNREDCQVKLLTNLEGGLSMLHDRFYSMDVEMPEPAPFKILNVSENFHDYIKERNTVYVIDYIDCPDGENFYLIGSYINKIDRKLQGLNSVAVIGLQKPMGRDIAFGGEQTLKNSTLYVALDTGKLKIIDAKVPATKSISPKNMAWTFRYEDEGTKFSQIVPFYGEQI